jgi:hypothetical protein
MTQVRDPALVALQRQLLNARRERPGPAGPAQIATRVLHDEVMQQLYGVGLAMQITQRRTDSPPVATRITDHLDQLQQVIETFRRTVVDEPKNALDARLPRGFSDGRRRRGMPIAGTRLNHPEGRVPARGVNRRSGSDPVRESRLVTALVTLTDTLVAGYDLAELLQFLVDTSVELLDAVAAGLVLADRDGHLNALAATSDHAERLEAVQIRTGHGPCLDCYVSGQPQSITDLRADADRWPQFTSLALEQGIRSVHAVPMRLRDRVIGALNLFRSQPGDLAEPDRRAAQALADAATIGILQQRDAQDITELNTRLEHALAGRAVIEQAKGILVQYGQLDMDQAFTALRDLADHHHVTLTEIAAGVVDRRREPADLLFSLVPAPRTPAGAVTDAATGAAAARPLSAPDHRQGV